MTTLKQNNETQLIIERIVESFDKKGFFQNDYQQQSLESIKEFILFREELINETKDKKTLLQKKNKKVEESIQSAIELLREGVFEALRSYCNAIPQLNSLAWSDPFLSLLIKELTDELLKQLVLADNKKSFYTIVASCLNNCLQQHLSDSEFAKKDYYNFLQSLGVYETTNNDSGKTFELKEYSIKELINESLLKELVQQGYSSTDNVNQSTVLLPKELLEFKKAFLNNPLDWQKSCLEELYGDTMSYKELMMILLIMTKEPITRSENELELIQRSSLAALIIADCIVDKFFEFNDNPSLETVINKPVLFKTYSIDQTELIVDTVINKVNRLNTTDGSLEGFIIIKTMERLILLEQFIPKSIDLIGDWNKHYTEFFWLCLYPIIKDNSLLQKYNPCLENFMKYSIKGHELIIHQLYDNSLLLSNPSDLLHKLTKGEKLEFLLSSIQKQFNGIERVRLDANDKHLRSIQKNSINKEFVYDYLLMNQLEKYKNSPQEALWLFYNSLKKELLNYKTFQLLLKPQEREYVIDSIGLLKNKLNQLERLVCGFSMVDFYDSAQQEKRMDFSKEKEAVLDLLSNY